MTDCRCTCSHFDGPHDPEARHPNPKACIHAEREEWRDHIPSGFEDMTGYGQVSCSCGWDSTDVLGWEQHINAATT